MGDLKNFARWRRRHRSAEINRCATRKHAWLPTTREFALSSIIAGVLATAWFSTTPERSSNGVAAATPAEVLVGRASIIDGDTLEIHGDRIRLVGIDAPEADQTCPDAGGQLWRCGQRAALALADKIGQATVSCEGDARDRYRRLLAICQAGGDDLGAWLVTEGWALAYRQYSMAYVAQETAARTARRGVWAGPFMPPWEWRAQDRGHQEAQAQSQTPVPAPSDAQDVGSCLIKGNISSKGERIYHVPGGRWYDETKISENKDERWFCTEAEARAAGWRPSKR